jgi:hypothetical protein
MAPPPRAADLPFLRIACGFTETPPRIFMKAYHFVGSLASEPVLLSKTCLTLIRCIICIGLLSACQTKREAGAPISAAAGIITTADQRRPQDVTSMPKSKVPPIQTAATALDPKLPIKPQSLSEQVGTTLRASFEVKTPDKSSLQVLKPAAAKSSSSLFEDSIILGRLRSFLKSSATTTTHPSVVFHAGVATMNFSSEVNSASASVLIAKMLSLDGVNEVRAVFAK